MEYTLLYKALFLIHPSVAFASYTGFVIAFIASILYIRKKSKKYDILSYIAIKNSFLLLVIAVILGMIFSKIAWGAYWSWDPKQTVTFVTLMIYLSYLYLRRVLDKNSREISSAALSIFGFVSVVFTYFSTKIYMTLHPEGLDSIVLPVNAYLFGFFMLLIPLIHVLYIRKLYLKSAGKLK